MIRYSCDLCGRELDPQDQISVTSSKMEVFAALRSGRRPTEDDDRDHLRRNSGHLGGLDDAADDQRSATTSTSSWRFDLCPECRKRFHQEPFAARACQGVRIQQQLTVRSVQGPGLGTDGQCGFRVLSAGPFYHS